MSWLFRKINQSDSDLVLVWRNNPVIYKYLFNPTPVAVEDHEKWLKKIIQETSAMFLVAEYEGVPAGTVRFDFSEDFKEAEVGIYLAPDMHGKGLSVNMLCAAEQFVANEYQALERIIAKVLPTNTASEKMFYKAEYKKETNTETYIQLRKILRNDMSKEVKGIKVGNRMIGSNHTPFIIAEMSGNHNQSLERAFEIIDAAAKAGAHALKIQTYTPDTMTLNLSEGEFFISDKSSLWKGRSLYDLYGEAYTPWEWHGPIFERCKSHGMIFLSTPFDASAVDFLETFNPPIYKIASFENTDLPLIKKVAQTGKPLIISTGMASIEELDLTVKTARENGCKDLILLKCTSSYPSTPENTNVLTIPHMRDLFNVEVGLSDHTMGIGAACASVALGATVVEKHFTLNRSEGGVDSAFSLEPQEMESLVIETNRAWLSLGKISYGVTEIEKKSLVFRRSIYIAEDVKEGDILNEKNLRCIRPGLGLPPKYYDFLLGKAIKHNLKKGTAMKLEYLF